MTEERSAKITLGGDEYELILTTKATKEIASHYGGLENLGRNCSSQRTLNLPLMKSSG